MLAEEDGEFAEVLPVAEDLVGHAVLEAQAHLAGVHVHPHLGEVGAVAAASLLQIGGVGGEHALAAVAVDARPPAGEPGEVAAEQILEILRIIELHPRAGERQLQLGHWRTLEAQG